MKIGIDLVEVSRFKNKDDSFFLNFFTKNEIEYCKNFKDFSAEHFAGFFSAKEAVMKALGLGIHSIHFFHIEIAHNKKNAPYVILHDKAKEIFTKKGFTNIEISISHTKKLAEAICYID